MNIAFRTRLGPALPPEYPSLDASATDAALSARLAAIDRLEILDTPAEIDFDEIVELAAAICGTPFAGISFVLEERQWFKAEVGMNVRDVPIGQSFCAHAIQQSGLMVVPDTSRDPVFADHPLVAGDPHLRFYAGMPVLAPDGTAVGALCVLDLVPHPDGIDATKRVTLRVLARQVERHLAWRQAQIAGTSERAEQASIVERLSWLADHDVVTGLPNRSVFSVQLNEACRGRCADAGRGMLLLLDLDHFKSINEQYGQDAGDAALAECTRRLRAIGGPASLIARQNGDEFSMFIADSGDDAAVEALLDAIIEALRRPFYYREQALSCRSSVGVAFVPDHGTEPNTLFHAVDLALAAAKAAGRDRACVFEPAMADAVADIAAKLNVARMTLDRGLITPFYQPKVDLKTGRVTGFEALLRWQTPDGTVMLPSTIAPAFDDPILGTAITKRIVQHVLTDMRRWLDDGVGFGHIAVNTSGADYASGEFADKLLRTLDVENIPAACLQIEVTESIFLDSAAGQVSAALERLNRAGVRIALDDFGTGFASLTHLKLVPVDVLKIDRTFIAGLGLSRDDAAIVRAVITLGQSLAVEIVGEGIETPAQAEYLRRYGCMVGQGYLFGRAVPASEVPATIARLAAYRLH